MTVNDFAKALRKWRGKTNLTREQAGILFDVSPRTIAGWELAQYPELKEVLMEGVMARIRRSKK